MQVALFRNVRFGISLYPIQGYRSHELRGIELEAEFDRMAMSRVIPMNKVSTATAWFLPATEGRGLYSAEGIERSIGEGSLTSCWVY